MATSVMRSSGVVLLMVQSFVAIAEATGRFPRGNVPNSVAPDQYREN
jgi:hypothetical protein